MLKRTLKFVINNYRFIQHGGWPALINRLQKILSKLSLLFGFVVALPILVLIRALSPWYVIRWGGLISSRIGHLTANVDLYLCRRAAGIYASLYPTFDIFYDAYPPVCNYALWGMWKRVINIGPRWIFWPLEQLNRWIPGGEKHEIPDMEEAHDRHNLFDRFPANLQFTPEEEAQGERGLKALGIPSGAKWVALIVRDSAYLNSYLAGLPGAWDYHNYRDCQIQNYKLVSETLADLGYFVIRMGAKMHQRLESSHPRIIDYAFSPHRHEFLDLFLMANCHFCITTGTGLDDVAGAFRRPIVYTNLLPVGYLYTFRKTTLNLSRRHFSISENRELSFAEIFQRGLAEATNTEEYIQQHIRLIENTPEELCAIALEMHHRLQNTWQPHPEDEALQKEFWSLYQSYIAKIPKLSQFHNQLYAGFSADYLRNNLWWWQPSSIPRSSSGINE